MVTVKSEICFGSGQFVGGAKNLLDQCAVDTNLPAKKFVNMTNFAREVWKNFGVTSPTAQKFMPFLE